MNISANLEDLRFCLFFIVIFDVLRKSTRTAIIAVTGAMLITDQCKQVETIDCLNSYKPEGNETVCCSDLKVYDNLCFFAQQKCKDPSLTVLYPGHCDFVTPPTVIKNTTDEIVTVNQSPVTVIPPDPILEAFCDNKDEITCSDELNPICGTDNKFYKNNCEFVKARCDDKDLGTQTLTVCKAYVRLRRSLSLL